MAKVSDVYAGAYVTAVELGSTRRTAGIFSADVEEIGQDKARKIVLALTAANGAPWPRKLVLNKTNALRATAAFGDDSADWIGKRIEVWAEQVQFQGKLVLGVHLEPAPARPGNGAALPAPAPAPAPRPLAPAGAAALPSIADELDDEIPF